MRRVIFLKFPKLLPKFRSVVLLIFSSFLLLVLVHWQVDVLLLFCFKILMKLSHAREAVRNRIKCVIICLGCEVFCSFVLFVFIVFVLLCYVGVLSRCVLF